MDFFILAYAEQVAVHYSGGGALTSFGPLILFLATIFLGSPGGLSTRNPSGLWVGRIQAQPWLRAEAAARTGPFLC